MYYLSIDTSTTSSKALLIAVMAFLSGYSNTTLSIIGARSIDQP